MRPQRSYSATRLVGRSVECAALEELVSSVRSGSSAVVVVRGEAGIGKTALLDYVAGRADGCRIVSVVGVESEMELAFGALHQLCGPLLTGLSELPEPQREALATAFGLASGVAPDRFLVGLAVLSLLANAAETGPVLCLVDDAQWLDQISAQTLEFIARRLVAESVGLVLAVRDPVGEQVMSGLPRLTVQPLRDPEARALVESALPKPIDARVRDRIIDEARGNPLAMLELPRTMSTAQPDETLQRADAQPVSKQIEQSYVLRVLALSSDTQRLLLLAAADPVGDVTLLRRAAKQLGLDESAAVSAEASGLIELGTRVRFRHPLARAAAYRSAAPDERRLVHRVLADLTDPSVDPERRAWHLARAAAGPDEDVALELERSAARARARGGTGAAAAFLERAAALTPDPVMRGKRTLAAAQAKHESGAFDEALELTAAAELSPLDQFGAATAALIRGQILSVAVSSSAGLPSLLKAAHELEGLDPDLARATYRDAILAVLHAGSLPGAGTTDVAAAVLAHPALEPSPSDLLLSGLARIVSEGYVAGAPHALSAVRNFSLRELTSAQDLDWLPLATRMAYDTFDSASFAILSQRMIDVARATGGLSVLPLAFIYRTLYAVHAGNLVDAELLAAEAAEFGSATGVSYLAPYGRLFLQPWLGNESGTLRAAAEVLDVLGSQPKMHSDTSYATAVLYNGLGRYDKAYEAAVEGIANLADLGLSLDALGELVEASVRLGKPEAAAEAVAMLNDIGRSAATDWAIGNAAKAQALASDGHLAEDLYREAIERLDSSGIRTGLARSRLCYGEWLRRGNRRVDARVELEQAYDMFTAMGAEAFAGRAHRELMATGATVRRRDTAAHDALTAQEAQIARLAARGLTNAEIGSRLYISKHTAEWHLRKVFAKLGITSRTQIRDALPLLAHMGDT